MLEVGLYLALILLAIISVANWVGIVQNYDLMKRLRAKASRPIIGTSPYSPSSEIMKDVLERFRGCCTNPMPPRYRIAINTVGEKPRVVVTESFDRDERVLTEDGWVDRPEGFCFKPTDGFEIHNIDLKSLKEHLRKWEFNYTVGGVIQPVRIL